MVRDALRAPHHERNIRLIIGENNEKEVPRIPCKHQPIHPLCHEQHAAIMQRLLRQLSRRMLRLRKICSYGRPWHRGSCCLVVFEKKVTALE